MSLTLNQTQSIFQVTLSSEKYNLDSLDEGSRNMVESLIERGYFKLNEENQVLPTTKAITNVKVFSNGMCFKTLLSRSNFKTVTRLFYLTIQKAFSDNIHLNVVFKNMTDEELDRMQQELDIARERRKNVVN